MALVANQKYGLTRETPAEAEVVEFSADTRLSGINLAGNQYRKGASESTVAFVKKLGGKSIPSDLADVVDKIAHGGATPLVVCKDSEILGVINLKDIVKARIQERFLQLRSMGIKTVMITGDNPLTAAAIAAEAQVDDFLAQAKPEEKLRLIREYQDAGYMVAMTGDGTNDAPALPAADVAVAMNTGTQPAREGNIIDLDSNPTKLLDIVEVGKQILMTRGNLTTFSISNDIAKYFAIIPAALLSIYPQLGVLNVMRLGSPYSAILSAVVQRHHHPDAGAVGPQGDQVPSHAGREASDPQSADLRGRGDDRAVCGNQGDRCADRDDGVKNYHPRPVGPPPNLGRGRGVGYEGGDKP